MRPHAGCVPAHPPQLSSHVPSPDPANTPTDALIDEVYAELRAIAQNRMKGERRDHSLQATALVNEAFIRLADAGRDSWANKAHFFHAAAEAMRRVLIDHARKRNSNKRGGSDQSAKRVPLSVVDLASEEDPSLVEDMDRAFEALQASDPSAAAVVRLRLFAGLSVEETASVLGISTRTVDREWAFARTVLYRAVNGGT